MTIINWLNTRPLQSYLLVLLILALAVLSPTPVNLLFIVEGVLLAFIFPAQSPEKEKSDHQISPLLIVAAVALCILTLAAPFYKNAETYFGYDVGFYKHYIEQPLDSFPRPPALLLPKSEVGARSVLDVFGFLGAPPGLILYGTLALWSVAISVLLWKLVQNAAGKNEAWWAVIFLNTSLAYQLAYQMFLWKQFLGLGLLLLVYVLLTKRSPWTALAIVALVLVHRTTAIFTLLSIVPTLWFQYPRHRRLLLGGSIIVALAFGWWEYEVFFLIQRIILLGREAPDFFALREGIFISPTTYLAMAIIALPLALTGVVNDKERLQQPLFWLGTIAAFYVFFHFPFYKRVVLFLDLAVVAYAAIGWKQVSSNFAPASRKKIEVILLIALILPAVLSLTKRPPAVSAALLRASTALKTIPDTLPVLVPSSASAPWVYGWSGRRIIAPGLFEDRWTLTEWADFWTTSEPKRRHELLQRYNQPLYIFITSPTDLATPLDSECFVQRADQLYKFTCTKP